MTHGVKPRILFVKLKTYFQKFYPVWDIILIMENDKGSALIPLTHQPSLMKLHFHYVHQIEATDKFSCLYNLESIHHC